MKRQGPRHTGMTKQAGSTRGAKPTIVYRMASGGCVWRLPRGELTIMWAGPGSRLLIGWCLLAGGSTMTIEHPSACDAYMTRKAAGAGVAAFFRATQLGKKPIE